MSFILIDLFITLFPLKTMEKSNVMGHTKGWHCLSLKLDVECLPSDKSFLREGLQFLVIKA